MRIAHLFDALCSLYDRVGLADIEGYLFSTEVGHEGEKVGNRQGREALYIRESADGVELGLYVAPAVIEAIAGDDPLEYPGELSCAIEGASHFLYVADRVNKGRSLSRLEIELQGEVDKFLLMHLMRVVNGGVLTPHLFETQFQTRSCDDSLSEEEIRMYETASALAAPYCSKLRSHYFNPLRMRGLVSTTRNFFERGMSEKMQIILS